MKSGLQVTRIRLMEFMNRKIDRKWTVERGDIVNQNGNITSIAVKKIRKSGTIRRQCFEISKPSYCIILFS